MVVVIDNTIYHTLHSIAFNSKRSYQTVHKWYWDGKLKEVRKWRNISLFDFDEAERLIARAKLRDIGMGENELRVDLTRVGNPR